MDFLLNGLTTLITAMSTVLQGFSWTRNLGQDIAKIVPYLQKANAFVPISEALAVLAILVTLHLLLIAYYWVARTINLLRGAG